MKLMYQLEADIEGGTWLRIRIWDMSNPTESAEVFEVGEPIHFDSGVPGAVHDVWWIEQLREEMIGADLSGSNKVVRLRSTRTVRWKTGYKNARPNSLVKLPAMLRIAVEANEL